MSHKLIKFDDLLYTEVYYFILQNTLQKIFIKKKYIYISVKNVKKKKYECFLTFVLGKDCIISKEMYVVRNK